ncbi:MAG: hypothetical protein FWE99_06210, partial [Bacteroidales bacterium]|nr:hypothetical protein [Bacteroidales bacterium]
MKLKILLLLLLQCCLPTVVVAGDKEGKKEDAGLWASFRITPKPVAERYFVTYLLEHRSKENFSETSLWRGSIRVNYNLHSWLKVGVGFEYFLNKETDGRYTPKYRYYPAALFSHRRGLFSGSFRSSVMNTFEK